MNTYRQDNLRLAEDAAGWILRRLEDRSPECSAELVRWLKISPQHIDEFLLAATTYTSLRGSDVSKRLDIDALLSTAATNVIPLQSNDHPPLIQESQESSVVATTFAHGRRNWSAVWAAGIAAGAIGAWMLWPHISGTTTYITGVGEQRMIRLADGSLLHLNTRSRVDVHFTEQTRALRLRHGEALFTVTHDAARPFRVLTDSASVQAVGTQFNVYEHHGTTKVAVLEGRVSVASITHTDRTSPAPALLVVGEQADVVDNGRIVKHAAPDVSAAVAWQQRRLIFRAAPLAQVAEEFNRYNDYHIRIEGEALAERLIWGVFPVDAPQALVKFLQQDTSVELETAKTGLIVRLRSGSSAP